MSDPIHSRELARIKAEYARRAREIAPDTYSLVHNANLFARQQLERRLIELLKGRGAFPLHGMRVADIGCGVGSWLLQFAAWGASAGDLAGLDCDREKITRAASCMPVADLRMGEASHLPWGDSAFDMVSQFTVFSSILSAEVRQSAAAEMLRVLKPGGLVIWYDMRMDNPANPAVRGMSRTEISRLFPGCRIEMKATTLAPPLARIIVPVSWTLGLMLESIPALRTHWAAVIRKPEAGDE